MEVTTILQRKGCLEQTFFLDQSQELSAISNNQELTVTESMTVITTPNYEFDQQK